MKMRSVGCPETSALNYYSFLINGPGERRLHSDQGGSLKSSINGMAFTIRLEPIIDFSCQYSVYILRCREQYLTACICKRVQYLFYLILTRRSTEVYFCIITFASHFKSRVVLFLVYEEDALWAIFCLAAFCCRNWKGDNFDEKYLGSSFAKTAVVKH